MTAVEIRKMADKDILAKIKELKSELFNLRFQAALGQLEDTARLGKLKKDVARMKTVMNERSKEAK